MKSIDPLLGTRTVVPSATLMKVCSYFNFDIFVHGPHHRHPRLTHGTLETKMHEYGSEQPDMAYPVYWKTVRDMLPSMLINPACGTLAGMAMGQPSSAGLASADLVIGDIRLPQVQVQEFVEDVVVEVIEARSNSQKLSEQ
ncbi:MAG: hypothetical protein ABGX16_18690 [Pirellulales bacterium]